MTSRQLVLDLPHRTALGRDDFLVTPSNAAAVAMIDRYPDWPSFGVVLRGEAGHGKSHLLEVWRQAAHATSIDAAVIPTLRAEALQGQWALAIDNAPGDGLDERGLFHLFNLARQTGSRILIASARDPAHWGVKLPDLASRLKALPVARLEAPDDALLRGVLVKLFADRQLAVEEQIVSYLMLRMPRSLDAARLLVEMIDHRALTEKQAVTRGLAARALKELVEPGLLPDED